MGLVHEQLRTVYLHLSLMSCSRFSKVTMCCQRLPCSAAQALRNGLPRSDSLRLSGTVAGFEGKADKIVDEMQHRQALKLISCHDTVCANAIALPPCSDNLRAAHGSTAESETGHAAWCSNLITLSFHIPGPNVAFTNQPKHPDLQHLRRHKFPALMSNTRTRPTGNSLGSHLC